MNLNKKRQTHRGCDFWLFQGLGWLLFFYLLYAQVVSAFSYDLGVSMGTQEPAEIISEVGVAFWKGFAVSDLIYVPLLGVGLLGQLQSPVRGKIIFAAALGITIYWPIVSLVAVYVARNADGWNLQGEFAYWIVLPVIALWGFWGMLRLHRESS
ncbi:MAG: hypothetical protein WBM41_10720 [Arenicellales bacterium]